MATNVFISYRRDDTRDFTGRIADRLRATPEIGQVFMDVDGIEPGADFVNKIEGALKQSEFCLLMIGPGWIGRTEAGPRIKKDGDFVRLEASKALNGGHKVVPILATGATMPDDADLPPELQELPRLNAISVRHESFDRDVDYLIDLILKRKKPSSMQAYLQRHPLQAAVLKGSVAFVVTLFTLVVVLALLQAFTGRALSQYLGNSVGAVWVFVVAVLLVGTALPFFTGRRPRRRAATT